MVMADLCIVVAGLAVCQVTWSMCKAGRTAEHHTPGGQAGCAELAVWIFHPPAVMLGN